MLTNKCSVIISKLVCKHALQNNVFLKKLTLFAIQGK